MLSKIELEELHAIATHSPLNLHPLIRACAGRPTCRPTSEYTDGVVTPEMAPATPFPPKRARKRTKKGA
jgi:hypothetical protein